MLASALLFVQPSALLLIHSRPAAGFIHAARPTANVKLVATADLGATMLSLVGIKPPAFQQGKAFLGKYVTEKPKYSFGFRGRMDERPDCSRTVIDGKYVYIRNFMPHLPHGQVLHYQMETQTTRFSG